MPLRILFADDDEGMRNILVMLLEGEGYTVTAVEDGQLLLDELAVHEYDLVFTDNNMPVKTGIEVLRTIRADERFKKLPIIVHTGDGEDTLRLVTELEGIPLSKPSQLAHIRSTIEEAVTRK